jgi:hypothetical protein
MPTRIISVSELKVKMNKLMAELEKQGVPYGKPKAVLARYDEYKVLKRLEDLEDLLAMKESLAAPESEANILEEYEHKRSTRISN